MYIISPFLSLLLPLSFLSTTIFAQPPLPSSPSSLELPSRYSTACSKCIIDAAVKISPLCTVQSFTTFPAPNTITDQQKACYCPLTTSDTWTSLCGKPDLCNAVSVNALFRGFMVLRSYACPASSAPNPTPTTTTMRGPNSASDFYPYVPASLGGPLAPYPPTTGDSPPPSLNSGGVTNGGIKGIGMRGLAAAASLLVLCFVDADTVGALL